jgi:hypothetical protein
MNAPSIEEDAPAPKPVWMAGAKAPDRALPTAAYWLGGEDLHPPIEREARVSRVAAHRRSRAEGADPNSVRRNARRNQRPANGLLPAGAQRRIVVVGLGIVDASVEYVRDRR